MKKITLPLLLLLAINTSKAQTSTWSVDATHTNVKFGVTHLVVSEVEGSFKSYTGKVISPTPDFNNATIEFTIDVNSINTEDTDRDKHLKSDDFFNAEKYPQMTFKSNSFKKTSGNNFELLGDLTIRDVTKKVKFAVTYGGTVNDPWGNTKAGFKANTTINRKDYKLLWSAATEAGGLVVSDEVKISINLELAKSK